MLSKKKKEGLHKNFSGDLQKKKKRSSQKFFRQFPQKNVFQKIFQALHKILTIQKIVLSSSRGQAAFRGLEAKDFKMCPRGRPRGQERPRGLYLCSKHTNPMNPYKVIWVHLYFKTQYFWSIKKHLQFGYTYNTYVEGYCLLVEFREQEVAVDLLFMGSNLPFGLQ